MAAENSALPLQKYIQRGKTVEIVLIFCNITVITVFLIEACNLGDF